jgi:hypothetical protein
MASLVILFLHGTEGIGFSQNQHQESASLSAPDTSSLNIRQNIKESGV